LRPTTTIIIKEILPIFFHIRSQPFVEAAGKEAEKFSDAWDFSIGFKDGIVK